MHTKKSLNLDDSIFIAGAGGMVGSAMERRLTSLGYQNVITTDRSSLDLTNQQEVTDFFQDVRPDVVFVAAAKVGGIFANATYPAEFLYENLMIASNTIHQAHSAGVNRLLFLGSTCIYPKLAPQPISEESLLTGPLEPTNAAYALAKIAGVKLCEYYRKQFGRSYISAMPTNLYGPGDNYHQENSHVLPALIRRFHEAKEEGVKEVTIWGTGTPKREFLFVDDLSDACHFLLKNYNGAAPINIGSDQELSIQELASIVASVVGFEGEIKNDLSKPDGTPRKKTDTSKINTLGWKATTPLKEGVAVAYQDFLEKYLTPAPA
jgi:GDP-L-fucose synthase